jgi:8-oxo-dGTP diphosphatase
MENFQNIRVAVDAIVFGYKNNSLYVLLIEQQFGSAEKYWAVPGGLVKNEESLSDAVMRELQEETNVKLNFMEQLYTFGDDVFRDSRNRVISIAYYALVDASNLEIKADSDAERVQWCKIDSIPRLAFDHNLIIEKAIIRLKAKLTYEPIGFDLLPKEFLFSDLENFILKILYKQIHRRNYINNIVSYVFLQQKKNFSQKKIGRPAKLFKFNKLKYNDLIEKGYHFEIKFA